MGKRARKGTVSYVILKATEARILVRQALRDADGQGPKELGRRVRALRRAKALLPGLARDAIIFEAQGKEGATGLENLVNKALAEVEVALRSLADIRLLKLLLSEEEFQDFVRHARSQGSRKERPEEA